MLTVWAKQGMGIYRDEAEYVAEPLPELDMLKKRNRVPLSLMLLHRNWDL